MAADIGQELYEKVKKSFDEGYASHEHIQNLIKRIKSGKADMIDVSSYSRSLGYVLSNAIRENVNADVLPDGQMYYNIAQKILSPLLHDNHTMVNDIAAEVQQKLDERRNIRIRPQKAPFPEERLSSIVSAASEEGLDEATMKRRMSSPAETMTASFSDDYMKENAKFRTRAGFKEYIVRKDDGNCCEWCAKLAGKYLYPESTPHDVFRRHDNCGCSVTYEDGGMRQDVWSKRTWEASPEELAERRELEEKSKPVRFSPEEAARKEKEALDKQDKERGISGKHDKRTSENTVDLEYINSKEYKDKFSGISGIPVVDNQIHSQAVAQLTHRNGSYGEDMTLINSQTGRIEGRQSKSKTENTVNYNKSLNKAIERNPPYSLISIHNHGTNNPPTGSDLVSNGGKKYKLGVVVTHNGKVFTYKAGNKPFLSKSFDYVVDKNRSKGYNEYDAIIETLKQYQRDYGIEWSER